MRAQYCFSSPMRLHLSGYYRDHARDERSEQPSVAAGVAAGPGHIAPLPSAEPRLPGQDHARESR